MPALFLRKLKESVVCFFTSPIVLFSNLLRWIFGLFGLLGLNMHGEIGGVFLCVSETKYLGFAEPQW